MPDFFDEIVASGAAQICIIAAPGSGKTSRILLPKLTAILAQPGRTAQEVVVLTFSRVSALDLKQRVAELPIVPRATTVHSFALQFLLSENNHEIRDRVDSILLDFHKEILLSDIKVLLSLRDRKPALKKVLTKFSAAWATGPHDMVFEEDETQRRFKSGVVNWLHEQRAAMMEEILYHAVDLARQLGSSPFLDAPQFILVDEYQDLNRLEQEFINLLAASSTQLLIVGDPDQSIYSFKFAYPTGINDFSTLPGVMSRQSNITGRCAASIVGLANQFLIQMAPDRTDLLAARAGAVSGEVHLVRRLTQEEEFAFVLESIARKLAAGVPPSEILVLTPRNPLGAGFATYANGAKVQFGIAPEVMFAFVQRPEFSTEEQEVLTLFALLVRPDAPLHIRAYIGLGDADYFAEQVKTLKERYGDIVAVFNSARADDFPKVQRNLRALCESIVRKRERLEILRAQSLDLDAALDVLMPTGSAPTAALRAAFMALKEPDDTLDSLYGKFIDQMRTIPSAPNTVRVMSLMASKGLDVAHAYIIGCNEGNLPGVRRSEHLTDAEHIAEQLRFLYVGVTRARESVTISWSQYIPYAQALSHNTPGAGNIRIFGGVRHQQVNLCRFLQALRGIAWE